MTESDVSNTRIGLSADELKKLVGVFLRYIAYEKCLSENTQEAYERDLDLFCSFIKEKDLRGDQKSAVAFLQSLRDRGYASSSCARNMIALKVFFRFLFREGYSTLDEGRFLDSPKLWQKLPEVLSEEDIKKIIHSCAGKSAQDIRDKAIFELLYGTGIRVSELCSLSIYDVADQSITVKGKGDKERLLPLGPQALDAVDRYLTCVRCRYESEMNSSLFVTNRGRPLDRINVWRMVKQRAKNVGITKEISPHTMRHTYATHLLNGGADIRVIQELLGHAHISSTDKYTHLSRSQVQERFFEFHPRK